MRRAAQLCPASSSPVRGIISGRSVAVADASGCESVASRANEHWTDPPGFHLRRSARAHLISATALLLALGVGPRAHADPSRAACRVLLSVAGGVQYGGLGLGGEYGCGTLAGYLGGGIYGGTGGARFLFGDPFGAFVSLGSGVLAMPTDPGTNVYFIPLDAIGGLRVRWGLVAIQLGIGGGLWRQLSSGPRSNARSGLILNPDVQLGVSFVLP